MNDMLWDIKLPMIHNEAKWLLKALDEYTDKNYNEIVSIVKARLRDIIDEEEQEEIEDN